MSVVKGENRRQMIQDALVAIDDQIRPVLKTKKYVILKPNCVSQVPLGTTNAEALMGILDYLAPRYKGPIMICESSGNTRGNYEALGYQKIVDQHRSQNVTLVDLNEEAKYEVVTVVRLPRARHPGAPGRAPARPGRLHHLLGRS